MVIFGDPMELQHFYYTDRYLEEGSRHAVRVRYVVCDGTGHT